MLVDGIKKDTVNQATLNEMKINEQYNIFDVSKNENPNLCKSE
jgi:hypothetical protein